MTSKHRLIALIVVWLAFAVAAISLFIYSIPLSLPGTTIALVALILAVAAVVGTWFITSTRELPS